MIPQNDLLLNPYKLYKNIETILKEYKKNIDENENFHKSYYEQALNELTTDFFWYKNSSDNICTYKYGYNSKQFGKICGAKVFVKSNDNLNKYLCSRHCRNYKPKERILHDNETQCNYIRNNNLQCKHKCKNNKKYCYIHEKKVNVELLEFATVKKNNYKIEKKRFLKKLEKKRFLYFLRKKNKYKHINNSNIIIKINKIINFFNFSKLSKKHKLYNYSNNYYNKDIT